MTTVQLNGQNMDADQVVKSLVRTLESLKERGLLSIFIHQNKDTVTQLRAHLDAPNLMETTDIDD